MTEQIERKPCRVPGCELPLDPQTGAFEGCTEHRALFDAQADHEAWEFAHEIMEPWVEAVRAIGHPELTQVMEKALAEVEAEVNRTLDVLEHLREVSASSASDATIEPSYREVLEGLATSRGFEDAEEVARQAVALDPSYKTRELLESPPGGFGTALDAVLHMNDEERVRITAAFTRTFMSPSRLKRIGS